jgi:gas vesicle protein
MWSSAKDSGSSWSETAAHESGKVADRVAGAADHVNAAVSDLTDGLKGSASQAADEAGQAADRAAEMSDDATTAATNLADEVKGGNPG